jgi:hypothetical protein
MTASSEACFCHYLRNFQQKGKTAGCFQPFSPESGAGKEVRTPDLNLGKVALYQLSYSRIAFLLHISRTL